LGLGEPTTTAISPSGSWFGLIRPVEVPGFTSEVGAGPSLPGGVPGADCGLSSPGRILGVGTGIFSSIQMDGLNKSYMNTPGGGDS
jgi:hypothetical protein